MIPENLQQTPETNSSFYTNIKKIEDLFSNPNESIQKDIQKSCEAFTEKGGPLFTIFEEEARKKWINFPGAFEKYTGNKTEIV